MKIRKFIKRLAGEQSGQLFIMVLIFLVFGSLVLGPLLSYIGSGVLAGRTFETKTEELYAADAGIEDAMWMIYNQDSTIVTEGFFTIIDTPEEPKTVYGLPPYNVEYVEAGETKYKYQDWVEYTLVDTVNEKTISVTIVFLTSSVYQIISTATGPEGSTTVEVFTKDVTGDYSGITDQIITTPGEFDDSPNLTLDYDDDPLRAPAEGWTGYWPDTPEKIDQFCEFFFWDVRNEDPYTSDEIDLSGVNESEGPLYREGDMNIYNSSNTDATLTLEGTLYITGQTSIGKSPKNIILDLNGNTIFVESDLTGGGDSGTALWIGGNCTLVGPGAIVAIGDIYFEPNIESGMTEPIFIMSASGTTTLQPGGNFYGAIAGEISVETQPGTSITYPDDGFDGTGINFPGIISGRFWGMETWNIN